MEIIARGMFCAGCEYFEYYADTELTVDSSPTSICRACGCNNRVHKHVHIVPA